MFQKTNPQTKSERDHVLSSISEKNLKKKRKPCPVFGGKTPVGPLETPKRCPPDGQWDGPLAARLAVSPSAPKRIHHGMIESWLAHVQTNLK